MTRRTRAWSFVCALGLVLLPAGASTQTTVSVPWRPGNADHFQMGAAEERWARSEQGALPVTVYRPPGHDPIGFVVLLHGCGGLKHESMWSHWVQPWAELFGRHGLGTAVVDSFAPRGVDQVCTGSPGAWAVRRADDAYSVRTWLAQQRHVDPGRISVMGMSNGGRTVLAALRATSKHADPFAAGIALYPGCQSDVTSTFYAPMRVLIGSADSVAPARYCEQMTAARPAASPELKLVVDPRGPHTFDMRLPDRTVLGMRLGHDADATADARRQAIEFLTIHGLIPGRASR